MPEKYDGRAAALLDDEEGEDLARELAGLRREHRDEVSRLSARHPELLALRPDRPDGARSRARR